MWLLRGDRGRVECRRDLGQCRLLLITDRNATEPKKAAFCAGLGRLPRDIAQPSLERLTARVRELSAVRVFILGPAFAVFRVAGAINLLVLLGSGRSGSGRSSGWGSG